MPELDHEDFMRGVIAKFGPRCFFCNLEGHFKSDCISGQSFVRSESQQG